jgi:acetyl esterase/lipase
LFFEESELIMRMHLLIALIHVVFVSASVPATSFAQQTPTHKDLAYDDDDPAQKLDVYLAKSDEPTPAMIYIHGGGWRAGSKNRIPGWLNAAVKAGWVSVVSVEYRFTNVAPHPAQVNDCMRAVQFVRQNAKKWNIDATRIGATGGSAGGHLSLWVALHDDIADKDSADPIRRNSSRISCAVSYAGPTDWSLLGKIKHGHPAYRQLLGYKPGTAADEMSKEKKTDVSPISYASEDDPPVLLVHGDKDFIVPLQHAVDLNKRLNKIGSESELLLVPGGGHGVTGVNAEVNKRSDAFIRKHLSARQ